MTGIWNSLRWRIVVYYTTLLAVAISVVLALGHRTETRHLKQLTAARMQAAGLGVLPFFFPPQSGRGPGPGQRPRRLESPDLLSQLQTIHADGIVLLAVDSGGTRIFESPGLPPTFDPGTGLFTDGQGETVEHAGHLMTELKTRGGDHLMLGMPLRFLRDEARDKLFVSIAIGAGVFLILGLIGMLLVFGGLRPVARMGRDAKRIAEGDLSARLDPAMQSEELRGLSEVLNQTFDRLGEALQRQVRFTADASHELRTPLAAILADCEFSLHKTRSPERYIETIEVCQDSARHMAKLVERLGLLARLDSDETTVEIEAVDLAEAARRAVSWVEPLAREHQITLRTELQEVQSEADPLRIGQVLLNLLRNAIIYNRPGGTVTIRSGIENAMAWFEVEDTGHGIPADKIDRVFERFFRADESRNTHTGGAGLGLAICKAIMNAHGGRIQVKSQPGEGTTFRLEWPALRS
jgi:signal transduction histidine kinase